VNKSHVVVFDLDDTLYLERDYVFSGFRAVSAWAEKNLGYAAAEVFSKLKSLFDEGVRGNIFDQWLASCDPKLLEFVPKLIEIYREHEPGISPLPEVPMLLSSLKMRYRLALLSDGYLAVQDRKLKALKLESSFDLIVFSDKWGREAWKPSTFCFVSLLEHMQIQGPHAVYIADNPLKDFSGPKQLGMKTVRFRHPLGVYNHTEPVSAQDAAHFEIRHLNELENILINHLS
jgi:putative hydrolase of the HAD superfamily